MKTTLKHLNLVLVVDMAICSDPFSILLSERGFSEIDSEPVIEIGECVVRLVPLDWMRTDSVALYDRTP